MRHKVYTISKSVCGRDRKIIYGAKGGRRLAAILAAACIIGGCAQKQPDSANTATATAGTVAETTTTAAQSVEETQGESAVNPMEEVDDALDFEMIGVHMILPAGAQSPSYHIINGQVADARFTLDGVEYTYRGSDTAEDFAGIFERFKDESISQIFDYDGGSVEAIIKTTESGGRLASWQWGSTRYTLHTAAQVDDEAIIKLTMELVELGQNER